MEFLPIGREGHVVFSPPALARSAATVQLPDRGELHTLVGTAAGFSGDPHFSVRPSPSPSWDPASNTLAAIVRNEEETLRGFNPLRFDPEANRWEMERRLLEQQPAGERPQAVLFEKCMADGYRVGFPFLAEGRQISLSRDLFCRCVRDPRRRVYPQSHPLNARQMLDRVTLRSSDF